MGLRNEINILSIPHTQIALFHLKIDMPLLKNPLYHQLVRLFVTNEDERAALGAENIWFLFTTMLKA